MSIRKLAYAFPVVLGSLLPGQAASAGVVFSTDFNSAAVGVTATSAILNSGGITTDDVNVRSNTGSAIAIVERTPGGDRAMQFTDNSSDAALAGNPRAYSNTFGPLSTTDTGNNRLFGSFDYTRLLTATSISTSPVFAFVASSGGQVLMDSSTNAIRFTVESNGHLFYVIGGSSPANVDSGFTLVTGTEYHFEIDADFSSTGAGAQDKWSLKVTPVGSSTPVVNVSGLNTRAANVQVNIISMLGGANQGAVNASPFAQIDNITFSAQAIPEPASMGLLLVPAGLLLQRKR